MNSPLPVDVSAEAAAASSAADPADDLVLMLDVQGAITSVNAAYSRATGWTAMEAQTRSDALWPGHLPAQGTERIRLEHRRRDGGKLMATWLVTAVPGPDGQATSYLCVGRDLTLQQRIADSLRDNDKLRAVAALSAGIAHDFNNLIGSINGLAELCELEAVAGSRQARNLQRIREAGSRAAVLVRRMLDFARQTPRSVQPVSAFDLVDKTAALLRASLPAGVELVVESVEDSPLSLDFVQVQQVLMNLANNGAHAMRKSGGRLCIAVDRSLPTRALPGDNTPPHARIRVIDCGEGMSPDVMDRIFEPFFTTKDVGEGTGLGLSAAHGVIAGHGGLIEVDSVPGHGSTFSVFLQVAD